MVDKLCIYYGEYIGKYGETEYYEFPTPAALSVDKVAPHLRELGFGYRAPYIQKTALRVAELEKGYLFTLRDMPYDECHAELLQFMGVGPKVADCVCLMSMDKHEVVPVDTHVWQIAQRDYKVARKYSKLNKDAYQHVAQHFAKIWGPYAGWAHSVMFTADLNLDIDDVKSESKVVPQVKVESHMEDQLRGREDPRMDELPVPKRIKVE